MCYGCRALMNLGLGLLCLSKGVDPLDADFRRGTPCQPASAPYERGWGSVDITHLRPSDHHHVQPERPEGPVSGNQSHISEILGSR